MLRAIWMTKWFRQNLHSDFHNDPDLIGCRTFPQEINAKMDGGLYMLHGITCLIKYLHMEDGMLNHFSLNSVTKWKKIDVPKIRNCLFRRLTERMEFCPWPFEDDDTYRPTNGDLEVVSHMKTCP